MLPEKQCVTAYLDVNLLSLLQAWGDKNRLTLVESIESILRQYLNNEDVVYQTVIVDDIQQRLETLEGKMLLAETISQRQVESIEKLEKQIAIIEVAVQAIDPSEDVEVIKSDIVEIKEELNEYWKKTLFIS